MWRILTLALALTLARGEEKEKVGDVIGIDLSTRTRASASTRMVRAPSPPPDLARAPRTVLGADPSRAVADLVADVRARNCPASPRRQGRDHRQRPGQPCDPLVCRVLRLDASSAAAKTRRRSTTNTVYDAKR